MSIASLTAMVDDYLPSSFCFFFPLSFLVMDFFLLFLFTPTEIERRRQSCSSFDIFLWKYFLFSLCCNKHTPLPVVLFDHPHPTLLLPFTTFLQIRPLSFQGSSIPCVTEELLTQANFVRDVCKQFYSLETLSIMQ